MKTEKKERPVLFSAPMARALLEGRKTMTRRIIKPHPPAFVVAASLAHDNVWNFTNGKTVGLLNAPTKCPYGKPGDRLWVKETHMYCEASLDSLQAKNGESRIVTNTNDDEGQQVEVFYKESASNRTRFILEAGSDLHWRPSIHMHRWASRITLEITDVRVERVESISEEDAKAEGIRAFTKDGKLTKYWACDPCDGPIKNTWQNLPHTAREAFLSLFYDINKRAKRGENPWVWCVSFRRIENASKP